MKAKKTKLTTVYITRWVLARGIVKAQVELSPPPWPRSKLDRASVCLPGQPYGRVLCLGRDFFLTLKEARADSKRQFEAEFSRVAHWMSWLEQAMPRLSQLQVHEPGKVLNTCHAFATDED